MKFQLNVRQIYKYIENDSTKYFVYIGDSDISNEIYGGEIGEKDEQRPYSKIDYLSDLVLFLDELKKIKADSVIEPLYIKGNTTFVPAFEFNTLIHSVCTILLNKYSINVMTNSDKNYDSNTKCLTDIVFPEKLIRLLMWNNKKNYIKFNKKNIVKDIYKYNVYFAYLGTNVGSEIEKYRPVLIWKTHINKHNSKENSFFVFPISSKIPKKNFYFNVPIKINGKTNIVKINDGKRISINRIDKSLKDETTKMTVKITGEEILGIKKAIGKYFLNIDYIE